MPRSLSKRLLPAPKSIVEPFITMLPECVTRPLSSTISVFIKWSSPAPNVMLPTIVPTLTT